MKSKSKLTELRKSLNISQKEISEIINVNQSVVSKIENGKSYGYGFVKYLEFLVSKNVDVNQIFEKEADSTRK